jgi:hypothetical protein
LLHLVFGVGAVFYGFAQTIEPSIPTKLWNPANECCGFHFGRLLSSLGRYVVERATVKALELFDCGNTQEARAFVPARFVRLYTHRR